MTINLDWFTKQIADFERERPLYVRHTETLETILKHALRLVCPKALVQVRTKTVQSFAEKVVRKHREDPGRYADPLKQFTDLCGGRVITRLQADVDAVRAVLHNYFTIDEDNSGDAFSRLLPWTFGYRSIHYIVQFKASNFLPKDLPVTIPDDLCRLRAEIQVRTQLQHAWADNDHELMYLSSAKVKKKIRREWSRLAAAMETADEAFSRFAEALDQYKSDYESYTKLADVKQEVERLQVVRKYAVQDEQLAHQVARLCLCLQDWDAVIELLKDIPNPKDAGLLYCIGHALCEGQRKDREHSDYQRGRRFLEQATELDPRRVEANVRLAEVWLDEKMPRKFKEYYDRAFDTDAADPQALCSYVRFKIGTEGNLSFIRDLKPRIADAVEKCRAQAEAGVNLPRALYYLSELSVLLGPETALAGLTTFARVMASGCPADLLRQTLAGLKLFDSLEQPPQAVGAFRRLLVLALAVGDSREDPDILRQLRELASAPAKQPVAPVVIVVGGAAPFIQRQMNEYQQLFHATFQRFHGTVFSGGTCEGIPGLVGEVGKAHPDRITTVGYVPFGMPTDGTAKRDDQRYHEIRTTDGQGFSALEPLQCWIDLLASGVAPERVRVLGINGGNIAAFEYRLGLLLGAKVGLVSGSGRKADALALEDEEEPILGLVLLPDDPMTLEAFLTVGAPSGLLPEQRRLMARRIHEDYCAMNRPQVPSVDIASTPWDSLARDHQEENLRQADDYQRKLAAISKWAVPIQGREIRCLELTADEVAFLAEMEHGRWVASKLLDGWTLGPRGEKQRPSLIAWKVLPEEEKQKDRDSVRNLPRSLKDLGFEIQDLDHVESRQEQPGQQPLT